MPSPIWPLPIYLGAGGEGDGRGWDGWMASLTWWTWIWVNSGSWWWTGRPGVLRFMGSQRVGHDWATELNWTEFTLIHGPNIPGSYAILLFTTLDFTSITDHIHNWVLFLFWLHLFILFGVMSSLISSSILGTYQPGEFIFQCPIFLAFHTVHGVLKAGILKCFAIPFSSGLNFARTLHHDPSILGGPTQWEGNRQEGKGSPNGGNSL